METLEIQEEVQIEQGGSPLDKKVNQILVNNKLNFIVEKRRNYYFNDEGLKFPSDKFSMIRNDTFAELGSSKDRYEIAQNHEVLKRIFELFGEDINVTSAQPYKNGKHVAFFIERPDYMTVGSEKIRKYIYALSSHDGTKSLAFGTSNMVMSCMNAFNRFYKNADTKIKHSKSMTNRLHDLPDLMKIHNQYEEEMKQVFTRWNKTKVNEKLIADLTDYVFNTDKQLVTQEISSRKKNQIITFDRSVLHEMETKGKTAFGLFNGVTHYTNHGKKYSDRTENTKDYSLFVGDSYEFNNRAYDFLLEKFPLN